MHMSLYAGLATFALAAVTAAGLMWVRYGEVLYFDRLVSAIANCI